MWMSYRAMASAIALTCWVSAQAETGLPQKFSQALSAAVALNAPPALATIHRDDWAARQAANQLRWSASPELSLGHASDAGVGTVGKREWEMSISASPMSESRRRVVSGLLIAEERQWVADQRALRWRTGGELLDLLTQADLARLDVELAQQRLAQWQALANEVEQRVKAGAAPRLDLLLVQASVVQAKGAMEQSRAALGVILGAWRGKTGFAGLASPPLDVKIPTMPAVHPLVVAAEAMLTVAKQRSAMAIAERQEPPRYSVGLTRDRGAFGEAAATTWRLGVSMALPQAVRSAPKLTAALREQALVEVQVATALRESSQQTQQARMAHETAQALSAASEQVARAQSDANALVLRAHRLGERDLQTRIKSDGDLMEATATAQRQATTVRWLRLKHAQVVGELFEGEFNEK